LTRKKNLTTPIAKPPLNLIIKLTKKIFFFGLLDGLSDLENGTDKLS